MEAAQQTGAYTPMGGEAEELYQRFVDRGGGSKDFSGNHQDDRRQLEARTTIGESMRIALLAATAAAAFLGGCGGPETSQANNAQANISNSASPPATANGSVTTNAMVMLATAPNKDEALKIMKQRHDAMEGLGKAMKTLHRALDASPARHQCNPRANVHHGDDRREDPFAVPDRDRARRRQELGPSRRSGSSRRCSSRRRRIISPRRRRSTRRQRRAT